MAEVARRPEEAGPGAAAAAPAPAAAPPAPPAPATAAPASAPGDAEQQPCPNPAGGAPEDPREVMLRLMERAKTMSPLPAIFKRIRPGSDEEASINSVEVPSWESLKEPRLEGSSRPPLSHEGDKMDAGRRQAVQKVTVVSKQKNSQSGRTYTSRYRGVHQTFPTRRWEAQFRRNGKPTSLGCFDHEEEAAKAYDKMIIWCELRQSSSKGGITNFDIATYEADIPRLEAMNQDDLVMMLRRDGRAQAAVAGKQAGASSTGGRGGGNPSDHAAHHNDNSDDEGSGDTESEAEDDG